GWRVVHKLALRARGGGMRAPQTGPAGGRGAVDRGRAAHPACGQLAEGRRRVVVDRGRSHIVRAHVARVGRRATYERPGRLEVRHPSVRALWVATLSGSPAHEGGTSGRRRPLSFGLDRAKPGHALSVRAAWNPVETSSFVLPCGCEIAISSRSTRVLRLA